MSTVAEDRIRAGPAIEQSTAAWPVMGIALALTALLFPCGLALAMTRGLSHDEHQHVAAGVLISRGLLPYRDFPHFHTPYLPFLYALLFRLTDHFLLAARLCSAAWVSGILGLVGAAGWELFRERGRTAGITAAAGAVLLCGSSNIFGRYGGGAWNHEPALFLSLAAFLLHCAGLRHGRPGWLLGSGVLLGLAIGVRITCAPLLAPFGLAVLLFPAPSRRKLRLCAWFIAGLATGGAGLLCLFAIAPEQTFFGILEFAKVNLQFRRINGGPKTMDMLRKLRFGAKEIVFRDVALFLAPILAILAARLAARRGSTRLRWEVWFVLLTLPFLLIGSFAPSPLYGQYFYPLPPFLVLLAWYAIASIPAQSSWFLRACAVGGACAAVSVVYGWPAYGNANFLHPALWTPEKVHRNAQELRTLAPSGRILTLAPIGPLEAGLGIYPPFSTGAFAWRVSGYIEPGKARRLGIATVQTLDAMLEPDPPSGVLVGFDEFGEDELTHYAERHAYRRERVNREDFLWVR